MVETPHKSAGGMQQRTFGMGRKEIRMLYAVSKRVTTSKELVLRG